MRPTEIPQGKIPLSRVESGEALSISVSSLDRFAARRTKRLIPAGAEGYLQRVLGFSSVLGAVPVYPIRTSSA
jgi:hypothetical protein